MSDRTTETAATGSSPAAPEEPKLTDKSKVTVLPMRNGAAFSWSFRARRRDAGTDGRGGAS